MSDLGPDARSLLDAARGGDDPTTADRTRVRKAVLAQIGAGVVLTAASTASSTAAASAATSSVTVLAVKVVAAVVLIGGLGSAGVVAYRSTTATVSTPNGTVRSGAKSSDVHEDGRSPPAVTPTSTATATSISTPTPTPTSTSSSASPGAPLAVHPTPAAADTISSLADETALLRDADSALRSGEPARALALLDAHASRFPSGVLAEERAAERVLALCNLGRVDEARADAARFFRDRPRSPLTDRVRASCGGS